MAAEGKKQETKKSLNIKISEDLHKGLKIASIEDGATLTEEAEKAIEEYLKNRNGDKVTA